MVAAAVILQQDNAVARPVASLSRAEVLTRYRHFREISKQHHSAVLNFLPKDTVISHARRIGLAQGETLVLDSMDDLNLVFDLLIHTAPKDRSRAIDRYARAARLAPRLMRHSCSRPCGARVSRSLVPCADTLSLA
jgi:hypothetical protein